MIFFPNAKINLGLNVLRRRADGYHDVETVLVPIGWCDILEIVPAPAGEDTTLTCSGRPVACPPEKNLVMKAARALQKRFPDMPAASIYLRKVVPDGAGLGGGSSDAAFTISGLNEVFGLGLSQDEMAGIAAEIGADCPFFVYNKPMTATGTGTTLAPLDFNPEGIYVAVAKPEGKSVSTAEAYARISPSEPMERVCEILKRNPESWSGILCNDFELSVGMAIAEVGQLKDHMLEAGAFYSAMSGSGSAVFGLFRSAKMAESAIEGLDNCVCWAGKLQAGVD